MLGLASLPLRLIALGLPCFFAVPSWAGALAAEVEVEAEAEESCGILLTKTSLEFKRGAAGYVRALTQLASKAHHSFYRRGGAEAFYLEMIECLPAEMRAYARQLVRGVGLLDYDTDNADVNPTAASRLLSAFRALVCAWNRFRPDERIDLAFLYRKEDAEAALRKMGIPPALALRTMRTDLEAFRDRLTGALPVLARLASQCRIPFSRKAREFFEQLWAALPEDTDALLRERARVAIAAVRDNDGGNAPRQADPAARLLDAWEATAEAHGHVADFTDGTDTWEVLLAMGAEDILEPPVVKFAGSAGGLGYFRAVVQRQKQKEPTDFVVRDFLLETAQTFLRGKAYAAFAEKIGALQWRDKFRRTPSKTKAMRSGGGRSPRQSTSVRVRRGSPVDGLSGDRTFEGLVMLVEAWNKVHRGQPSAQIDLTDIHSPEALFRVFAAFAIVAPAPPPREPRVPSAPVRKPRFVRATVSMEEPLEEEAAVPEEEPEPEPEPEPAPEPEPVRSPGPAVLSQPLAHFRSASGGLAFFRGIQRQYRRNFETPFFLREFFFNRTMGLPMSVRDTAYRELAALGWESEDSQRAFTDDATTERILRAFRIFAHRWNEGHANDRPVMINLDTLFSAEGMYIALLWWDVGSLEPARLAERPGSGFVYEPVAPR